MRNCTSNHSITAGERKASHRRKQGPGVMEWMDQCLRPTCRLWGFHVSLFELDLVPCNRKGMDSFTHTKSKVLGASTVVSHNSLIFTTLNWSFILNQVCLPSAQKSNRDIPLPQFLLGCSLPRDWRARHRKLWCPDRLPFSSLAPALREAELSEGFCWSIALLMQGPLPGVHFLPLF